MTQSYWSSKPVVKPTAKTSLSKLMLAVKGLTMFKFLSNKTVRGCGLSASNQVMLTCGGFTMDHHKFQPTPMPEGPATQPPAPEEVKLRFSSRPVTDWPNWRPSAPYINYEAQDGALDRRSRYPSNWGPGFELYDWSIKVTLPKVVMWSNKQNGAASRP